MLFSGFLADIHIAAIADGAAPVSALIVSSPLRAKGPKPVRGGPLAKLESAEASDCLKLNQVVIRIYEGIPLVGAIIASGQQQEQRERYSPHSGFSAGLCFTSLPT